ncbi:MAG TPA: SprB repeat-containing protein, partial [Bacteroidia bacterium]|nr:SprB repeat-containing protein [Bacteroidia bacterium]
MKIRLLFLLSALTISFKGIAQFSGDFAPNKWTFSTTTVSGDGSVNTSGAPTSIVLNGSDNDGPGGGGQYENWQTTIVNTGTISFSYSHVNPDVDKAYYVINGTQTLIATSGSGTKSNIAVTAGNTFAFRIVNDDNCCGRGVLTISNFVFTPATPSITTQPANSSVCATSNTTFSIVAANATSYQWQEDAGSGFTNISNGGVYSGATTTALTLTGVPVSMNGYVYRCIATGSLNPPATSNSATLTVSSMTASISSKTDILCNGASTGAATVSVTGGIGTKTYSWAPSGGTSATANGLAAGTYTCTITDAISCSKTQTVTITQPASALNGTTVVTNVACFGGSNGAINLTPTGGTGPYTYNWLPSGPTTEDRTGLTAGTFSVQITDANGCTKSINTTVTQPASAVSGTTVVTNVACFGGSNGAINLTPTGGTGPYTYNWLPSGPTTEERTGLTAGTFSVQITDANGCTGTNTVTVTQPTSPVSGTTVVTNVACFGGSNGAINLTPTGGTGPYTYNWLPSGPTTEDRTGLAAGTFSVQITDANGCTGTNTVTVTQPSSPVSGTTVVTNVACFGGSNGAINLTPTGGTGPYTYNWLPSGPTTE